MEYTVSSIYFILYYRIYGLFGKVTMDRKKNSKIENFIFYKENNFVWESNNGISITRYNLTNVR